MEATLNAALLCMRERKVELAVVETPKTLDCDKLTRDRAVLDNKEDELLCESARVALLANNLDAIARAA